MRTEAVLFDLDGTLADTAPDLGASANHLRAQAGLPPLPLSALRPHTSSGVRGMLGAAFGLTPDAPEYAGLAERFLHHYADNLCVNTRLFEQMDEVLDALDGAGIRWGIVTNKRRQYTEPLMAALQLHERACCIISGDSAPRPKPAPDPLLLACEVARLDATRCLYVGDDLRDIQAGHAAGMVTVAAGWGYLGTDSTPENWQAHHLFQQPRELLVLLGIEAC